MIAVAILIGLQVLQHLPIYCPGAHRKSRLA